VLHILQVLHLNISKVDRVLHMGRAWEAGGDARGPLMQSSGAGPRGRAGGGVLVRA
jgi:hypothetical protein